MPAARCGDYGTMSRSGTRNAGCWKISCSMRTGRRKTSSPSTPRLSFHPRSPRTTGSSSFTCTQTWLPSGPTTRPQYSTHSPRRGVHTSLCFRASKNSVGTWRQQRRSWRLPRSSGCSGNWSACGEKDTYYISSTSQIVAHPAFQRIIELGDVVLPLLLAEVRARPSHLIIALKRITGEDPVSPDDRGKLRAMADTWVKWGEARQLI